MNKFKVGDRVEFKTTAGTSGTDRTVKIGDTGVVEIANEDNYKIRMDKDKNYWYVTDIDIKLISSVNPYDESVKEMKQFYDAMINAGFPEKRAWASIRIIIRENARK